VNLRRIGYSHCPIKRIDVDIWAVAVDCRIRFNEPMIVVDTTNKRAIIDPYVDGP
jgi:hypothetical protein